MLVRLSCGVEFEQDPAILDDMQLIDLIAEADEDDPASLSKLVRSVYGNARSEVYDALRTEDGRVPLDRMVDALRETLAQLLDADEKKYLPSSTS